MYNPVSTASPLDCTYTDVTLSCTLCTTLNVVKHLYNFTALCQWSIMYACVLPHARCKPLRICLSAELLVKWCSLTEAKLTWTKAWLIWSCINPATLAGATVLLPCGVVCVASRLLSKLVGLYHGNLRGRSSESSTIDCNWLTHSRAQFSVLSLILFVNCNVFYKTEVWFLFTYSNNQMENMNINMSDHGSWSKHLTVR